MLALSSDLCPYPSLFLFPLFNGTPNVYAFWCMLFSTKLPILSDATKMRQKFDDTGQYLTIWLVFTVSLFSVVDSIILTGAPDSYARWAHFFLNTAKLHRPFFRYPKWAHSFENSLSMELKTRQSDGMLLYTDDGGTHGNFYSLTIVEGHIQLDFR